VSQIQNFGDAKNLPRDAVSLFEIQEVVSIGKKFPLYESALMVLQMRFPEEMPHLQ
jgi:hypothetical protein